MGVSEYLEVTTLEEEALHCSPNQLHWETLTSEVELLSFHRFHVIWDKLPCLSKPSSLVYKTVAFIIKLLASNEIILGSCPHSPVGAYFSRTCRREVGRQAQGRQSGCSGLGLGSPAEQHVLVELCSVRTELPAMSCGLGGERHLSVEGLLLQLELFWMGTPFGRHNLSLLIFLMLLGTRRLMGPLRVCGGLMNVVLHSLVFL